MVENVGCRHSQSKVYISEIQYSIIVDFTKITMEVSEYYFPFFLPVSLKDDCLVKEQAVPLNTNPRWRFTSAVLIWTVILWLEVWGLRRKCCQKIQTMPCFCTSNQPFVTCQLQRAVAIVLACNIECSAVIFSSYCTNFPPVLYPIDVFFFLQPPLLFSISH